MKNEIRIHQINLGKSFSKVIIKIKETGNHPSLLLPKLLTFEKLL